MKMSGNASTGKRNFQKCRHILYMQNIARVYKITGLISIMLMSSFFVAGQTGANANAAMEVYADTLLGRADYKGALELYDKLIESSKPSSTEQYQLLYKRAVCYYGLQNFETALKEINVVIEKYPEAQSKLLRAYIYQELGNYDAQLADLNDLLSENPDNLELIQWRVSVLMEAGKYEEAQKDIRKLLSFQSSPELKSYLGLSYYYQGDPDSAMIIFDEVLKEDPGFTNGLATTTAIPTSRRHLRKTRGAGCFGARRLTTGSRVAAARACVRRRRP
jgi:hypothetical protein